MSKKGIVPIMLGVGLTGTRSNVHDGLKADFVNGQFYTRPSGGALTQYSNAQSMFTWSSSTKYTRNASGVLVASGANTPAYEWTNAGAALGVRVEGARTNSCLQSENFATTWTRSGILAFGSGSTVNAATAPDGNVTADLVTEDSTAATDHSIRQAVTTTVATWTFSVFVKQPPSNARRYIMMFVATGSVGSVFDLQTGTDLGALTLANPALSSGIEAWANGWYRCWVTYTGAAASVSHRLYLLQASTAVDYNGDGVSGLYMWGGQVELGDSPSTYIPTTTGAVTRNADAISRTLGSEFSATAGTLLTTYSVPIIYASGSDRVIASIDDGTANERFRYRIQASQSDADFLVTDGGVAQADIDGPAISANTTVKAAMAWSANDFELVVNGTSAGTDVSGTLPTVTTLNLGAGPSGADGLFGHIQKLEMWPTRLTQAQMQTLTA